LLTVSTAATNPTGQNFQLSELESSGKINVVVRRMPKSCFTVGQTQPRVAVYSPKEQRHVLPSYVNFHVGRRLHAIEHFINKGNVASGLQVKGVKSSMVSERSERAL